MSGEVPEDKWLVDSGAASHMTPKREYFTEYQSFSAPEKVALGDGRVVEAVGAGTVQLNILFKVSNNKRAVMHDVLYVLKLSSKSLYGLKHAPRCWNRALKEFMMQAGFVQSSADPCVFTRLDEHTTIVAVYVDDLILTTDVKGAMLETKRCLSEQFKMKDMGQLHYCLGVNIVFGQKWAWLHQQQYIMLMLRKFALTDTNTVSTPADCNVKLVKDDHVSKPTDQVEYRSMVGSLLYIAMGTHPDIAQEVGAVSKFCSNPSEAHKTAVKRIFRYLKKTTNLALKYCKDEEPSTGLSDADWGGDLDETLDYWKCVPTCWWSSKLAK